MKIIRLVGIIETVEIIIYQGINEEINLGDVKFLKNLNRPKNIRKIKFLIEV